MVASQHAVQHQSNDTKKNVWATFVMKELPCQKVHTNSEDSFVVAVATFTIEHQVVKIPSH